MNARSRTVLLGAGVSLLLFAVMGYLVAQTDPWQGTTENATAVDRANDLGGVTGSLFGPDVIAFEVLGILLTAVMVGALVIARPLDAPSDESRYSHPTKEQVAETDRVSDPEHASMSMQATDEEAAP